MAEGPGEFTVIRPLKPFLGRGSKDVRANIAVYMSGKLAISAWLYLPPENWDGSPKGLNPLDLPAPKGSAILVGHGGVGDVPSHYDMILRRLAASGWTIVAPSYRGEGSSDGEIEFAAGEVDDTLACLNAMKTLPGVDPDKIWLLGSSHGAMVNLLVLARDEIPDIVQGAISLAGVYDLHEWFSWLEEFDHPLMHDPIIAGLMRADADEIDRRSAILRAEHIGKPVFLLHGESDTMVPVEQTEKLHERFIQLGKADYRVRIEPGSDHEYIWGPVDTQMMSAWKEILDFIESHMK